MYGTHGDHQLLSAVPNDGLDISRHFQHHVNRSQLDHSRLDGLLCFSAYLVGFLASGEDTQALPEYLLNLGHLPHECKSWCE